MRVRDEAERRVLDAEARGRVAAPTYSWTALRGLPCQHCTSPRRAAGWRVRSHAIASSSSRSRASSIERTASDPGAPKRDGSMLPVAP